MGAERESELSGYLARFVRIDTIDDLRSVSRGAGVLFLESAAAPVVLGH